MGSCYLGDHIVKDYIHTGITACKIEEPRGVRGVEEWVNIFIGPEPRPLLRMKVS